MLLLPLSFALSPRGAAAVNASGNAVHVLSLPARLGDRRREARRRWRETLAFAGPGMDQ